MYPVERVYRQLVLTALATAITQYKSITAPENLPASGFKEINAEVLYAAKEAVGA